MSQSWGPTPNYPPPRPPMPPQQSQYTNTDAYLDYYPEGDPPLKRALFFLAGSCSTLLLVGFCICALTIIWIVDARYSTPASQSAITPVTNAPVVPPASQPDFGEVPAPPVQEVPSEPPLPDVFPMGQAVQASDVGLELTVLDIQRNVQPINLQAAEGLEFVAISVELKNLRTDSPIPFLATDFQLQDAQQTSFSPNLEADNGRSLRDGSVPVDDYTEGDLLFHIPAGHAPLTLVWTASGSQQTYLFALQ